MCGIYAILCARRVENRCCLEKLHILKYRGPDSEGYFSNDTGSFNLIFLRKWACMLVQRHYLLQSSPLKWNTKILKKVFHLRGVGIFHYNIHYNTIT